MTDEEFIEIGKTKISEAEQKVRDAFTKLSDAYKGLDEAITNPVFLTGVPPTLVTELNIRNALHSQFAEYARQQVAAEQLQKLQEGVANA